MSDDLIERLRAVLDFTDGRYLGLCSEGSIRTLLDGLAAKDTALSEMRAELERAQAETKRLKTPDSYWEWSDPENGYTDISEALCDAPMGGVVRLMAGKTLDDIWATTRALTVDDNGDWDDHEIAIFDNPIDAEKCWSESLAAARALAPQETT